MKFTSKTLATITSLFMLSTLSFAMPMNSTASQQLTEFIIGTHSSEYPGKPTEPLLLASEDKGESWAVVQKIVGLSEELTYKNLFAASCAGNYCITVGNTEGGKNALLMLTSSDYGKVWSYTNNYINLPKIMTKPTLSAVTCLADYCVAIGEYKRESDIITPLLLINTKNNPSWVAQPVIPMHPRMTMGELLTAISCKNDFCVASGYEAYMGDHFKLIAKPDLLVTNDKGKTWRGIKRINGFPATNSGSLSSVECGKENCIAIGTQGVNFGKIDKLPLIIRSKDKKSWNVVKNISGLPNDIDKLELKTINCTDDYCLVGGGYSKVVDYHFNPIMLISNDNGASWSTANNLFENIQGEIQVSHCSNTTCVLAGDYIKDNHNIPLLVVSNDKGKSWNIVQTINALPSDIGSMTISTVRCNENDCTAAGVYESDNKTFPLILISHDSGSTWTFIASIRDLPANLQRVTINAATNTGLDS